eukprot:CAMPEP_0119569478 /NCGR_PEP_ID=MMETSP1352-20130426/41755_1 /TAXON_ID=265584 /ORGANISM="Stauroneis constricta, Strain CCMP1120" /LENGTH=52 /DNA_ID=CAMNT_0007619033 /DNA_START=80 /DNA_END=235 /DNA_ORIENTATION=+
MSGAWSKGANKAVATPPASSSLQRAAGSRPAGGTGGGRPSGSAGGGGRGSNS